MRKIVVRDRPFSWSLTPGDDGLRVVIRGERRGGGKLFAWFGHDVLVTPYVVRLAIERGLDAGWDPANTLDAGVHFAEPVADRPVAVDAPPALEPRERALLEAIADTEDPAARLVYADWLLERGDPQGELIAVACRPGSLDPTARERLAELEAQRDGWLGPVAAIARDRTWQDGMLDACTLQRTAAGVVDAALNHRAWRTLSAIDARARYLAVPDLVRLVAQPDLPCLHTLVVPVPVALELARAPVAYPRLRRLGTLTGRGKLTPAVLAGLAERMPALEELALPAIPGPQLAAVLAASPARRIAIKDFAPLRQLDRLAGLAVDELICAPHWQYFDQREEALVVRRGVDGALSSLEIVWVHADHPQYLAPLLAALATIAADTLIELRVDTSKPPFVRRHVRAQLAEALAAQPRVRIAGISPAPSE